MDAPRPRRRRLGWFLPVLILVPVAIGFWNRSQTCRKLEVLHAEETRKKLHPTAGATVVRVWGAGMRTGSGFCGCAIVPKPERVLYETKDPAQIADLLARIQPRPYLTLEPPCACCSNVTIDFLRDETLLLSMHLKGEDLPSTKGAIPITSGSRERIEDWLAGHRIRETLDAALRSVMTPKHD